MQRPRTVQEYVKLVDDTIIELEELRESADYDMESAACDMSYLEPIVQAVRDLRASMGAGSYAFANQDLSFMAMITGRNAKLPCADMLVAINTTHRKGLDVED
jgi:hypothetical protein